VIFFESARGVQYNAPFNGSVATRDGMSFFERFSLARPTPAHAACRRAFSLVEVLVTVAVILTLASMTMAAVSVANGSGKKVRTRTVIAKIDAIIMAQYESYAGRSVAATSDAARGEALRALAKGDLPDTWSTVAALAAKSESELTPHQRAYVAVWKSVDQAQVVVSNASPECLFLAVMHGGLADCLDCDSLRIEVGDTDNDGMPEFLDAWNRPIGFVHAPSGLRLPFNSNANFFSSALPFDPVVATSLGAKGGLMRPLIVSAGTDGALGLGADASQIPGSNESRDNLTNFDEEAKL
jgi:prepilin-type N-terminal cleavage/methylation domain-containing protein